MFSSPLQTRPPLFSLDNKKINTSLADSSISSGRKLVDTFKCMIFFKKENTVWQSIIHVHDPLGRFYFWSVWSQIPYSVRSNIRRAEKGDFPPELKAEKA